MKKIYFIIIPAMLITSCMIQPSQPAPTQSISEFEYQELNVKTPEVTLYTRVAGNPQSRNVLIAIHGGPGNSSDYMVSLQQLAGDDMAVVIYDQRGTARSSNPGDDSTYFALAKYVEDVEAIRAAIGAEKIFLLGHSWGGIIAMRYATVYPQNVRSLVLMGSGAPSMQAVLAAQEGKARRISQLQEQGIIPEQITSVQDILPAYFSDPHFDMPVELNPLYYNGLVEQYTWEALGNFDFTTKTKALDLPVLVLSGQDDPFGRSMVEAVVSSLSNAEVELVFLEKCGHFWHECPDQFFPRVRDFLKVTGSQP